MKTLLLFIIDFTLGLLVGIAGLQAVRAAASVAGFVREWLQSSRVAVMYDPKLSQRALLNMQVPESQWMNFGLWTDTTNFVEACRALSSRLLAAASIEKGHSVLDVGCGCGDQMLLCAQTTEASHIVGIDLSAAQVDQANIRAHALLATSPANHVEIRARVASAVNLPAEADSLDRVLSLDSAYHFVTREDFFRESHRVLRDQGKLAIVDFCLTDGHKVTLIDRIVAYLACVPPANLYDCAAYTDRLRQCGFTQIHTECLSPHVFAGFATFIRTHHSALAHTTRPAAWSGFAVARWLMDAAATRRAPLECILVTATKQS